MPFNLGEEKIRLPAAKSHDANATLPVFPETPGYLKKKKNDLQE